MAVEPGHIVVDGTLGGGGHASHFATLISPGGILVGIDQDKQAHEAAAQKLESLELEDVEIIQLQGNFSHLDDLLEGARIPYADRIFLDIGVSSHQIDSADRGFSFKQDAPLDMRMDLSSSTTAAEILASYSEEELARIIREYGEDRWASRIAQFIVRGRKEKAIETSFELVEIIKAAIPASARRRGGHPAKKTFQALRIEVNRELEVLEEAIESALRWLSPKGRLGIITFHSLEDRMVKRAFAKATKTGASHPADLPIQESEIEPQFRLVTRRAVQASKQEIEQNARSRSAKLRVIEKSK